MERVLIISPHSDDEIFGAFSFLKKGNKTGIISINEEKLDCKRPTMTERLNEIGSVAKFTGGAYNVGYQFYVNHFHLHKANIITFIEKGINDIKPDTILIPHPSYNQDHQTIYEACIVALRPHDKNHFVKKVLVYEVFDYTKWGENQMSMNYFKEVDIKAKLKAYKLMKSQVRSYRSPEQLKAWAKSIGERCNLKYAEGFNLIRDVDGSTNKL